MFAAACGLAAWYRQAYNVWPGQGPMPGCTGADGDYESFGGLPRTWKQITVREPAPVHAVGHYPPLGWPRQELFAASWPRVQRLAASKPPVCAQWWSTCVPAWTSTGPTALRAAHDTVIQPSPLHRNGSHAIGDMSGCRFVDARLEPGSDQSPRGNRLVVRTNTVEGATIGP
jgi:hypothetical protein